MSIVIDLITLAKVIDGELIKKSNSEPQANSQSHSFIGLGSDSREDLKNKIFVALRGDVFDAHSFLFQAVSNNASCLIIDKNSAVEEQKLITHPLWSRVNIVLVEDTLTALQSLSTYWRKKCDPKVIAITGSNGKTTVKEYTASILSKFFPVSYSKGSFNNHWGVPFTLLNIKKDDLFCVAEMGMNHLSEIENLTKIALPNITICTMVGSAHIGKLKSIENIAKAKNEIYLSENLEKAVFNLDNKYTLEMLSQFKKNKLAKEQKPENKIITYSTKKNADVFLRGEFNKSNHTLNLSGNIGKTKSNVNVKIIGEHNIQNLAAAAALCLAADVSEEKIWQGLKECQASWGRNQILNNNVGSFILFDAYNANLESMYALIETAKQIKVSGNKTLIIGEIFEMGDQREQVHKQLAKSIASEVDENNFQKVYFIGESHEVFKKEFYISLKTNSADNADNLEMNAVLSCSLEYRPELADQIDKSLSQSDAVFLKASRGMAFEQFLDHWKIDNPKY